MSRAAAPGCQAGGTGRGPGTVAVHLGPGCAPAARCGDNRTHMKNTILPLQLLVRPSLQDDVRPLILYHGRRCPDGYGAALAAWSP